VILVRHAMPEVRPEVPAERWELGEAGRAAARACGDTPLVVVGHGQALTLWLRDIGAIADAPRFWSALAFPDAWAADLAGHAPVRVA
jgi:hypothetical protein